MIIQSGPDPRNYAVLSACRRYRYELCRQWNGPWTYEGRRLAFVLLNPSTADGLDNDPTVARCLARAREWRFDALHIVNLFAFRTTNKEELDQEPEPCDPTNERGFADSFLEGVARRCIRVIVGWGQWLPRGHDGRPQRALELIRGAGRTPYALRLGKTGRPMHPLYLPYNLIPKPYTTVD